MLKFNLIAPCHFGLESVLKKEITDLGYDIKEVSDGRVAFEGDGDAVARANTFLRTPERILIEVGGFRAETFDELFEGIRALEWEKFIPKDGRFWVTKAASVNSRLFSPSDIQSIVKKAVVERLKPVYGMRYFEETGEDYPIRIFIKKDLVTAALDTTGVSLHKRGYRQVQGEAPIAENLAASLLMLTPWKADRSFVDPFCGSGTFPIEAAMIAAGIAPGLNRHFTSENWPKVVPPKLWLDVREEARDMIRMDVSCDIQGYDIDAAVLSKARQNAAMAGVDQMIHFQRRPLSDLSHHGKYGFVVTNPPYGQRMEEEELPQLYRQIGEAMDRLPTWSFYLITAYGDAERMIGRRAAKNRKIYNGMIKTYYYQFPGPKPPRRPMRKED
ncbi:MAG: class I SAM-dependent RNA methyltransferase [Lachnospiraceae bacterium]|nr:class I SAM-dependent RNA methyltransferase [Lachnospiraceae bacterium]